MAADPDDAWDDDETDCWFAWMDAVSDRRQAREEERRRYQEEME